MKIKKGEYATRAKILQTPTDQLLSLIGEDEEETFLQDDDVLDEDWVSFEDMGLGAHGCADDEGCDEPGCPGGPAAYDNDVEW